jgi:hypothetical protein
MEFEIRPFESVGVVQFGMTQTQVREALRDLKVKEYWKTPESLGPTDHFIHENLHVFYDEGRRVRGIEIFRPTGATFDGRPIVGQAFSALLPWLRQVDPDLLLDDSGAESTRLGLSLFVPELDDDSDAIVESVYLSRSGA